MLEVADKEIMTVNENGLASLYHLMKENKDDKNAEKIVDLFEKIKRNQFNTCFAGHFSAGKSSMINYILGKDVLPKSPIPTSANIVKILSGAGVARIYFNEETPVEYMEPYDIDMIKDYCMNKDMIKQIEIQTSEKLLPDNTALLDTPGIDAADDADRLMTESALHIVDVLYYVMDYNHVQSEVNLYFLQKIQSNQIPFYIIINQIDKHNEKEIRFEQYDKAIKQTFDQWNIYPRKIYYSSVKYNDVAHNQLSEMKADLFNMLNNDKKITDRITIATKQIMEAHKLFLKEEYEDSINHDSYHENYDPSRVEQMNERLSELDDQLNKCKNEFYEEVNQTVKNAYLMPATLRDKAKAFLESQHKDFKVGFFNARKKTCEEKQLRLHHFFTPLQKTIESTIQWKLRDKFLSILRKYQLENDSLLEEVQHFTVTYEKDNLLSFIKSGATINGNYIINYTNEISSDIKNISKQQANQLWKNIEEVCLRKINEEKEELIQEKTKYDEISQAIDKQVKLKKKLTCTFKKLDDQLLNDEVITPEKVLKIEQIIKKRFTFRREEAQPIINKIDEESDHRSDLQQEIFNRDPSTSVSIQKIVHSIETILNQLMEVKGMNPIVSELQDKKARLLNRELTVALFGAFSAGKSSFSNALFGESILPVSPNPTTAVISKILPVTEYYKHGTVVITFKSEETLISDLKTIIKDVCPNVHQLYDLIQWLQENKVYQQENITKTYQAYLRAILIGYDTIKDVLGQTMEIQLHDFAAFVTNESKACYIEMVEVYYHCPLTEKGITIVDTPGADSVNARHTNVAFDYIKEADALIYVTYYNHAITSADRDFLIQLGRVKEAFELDKMFFIVNASDLADDEEELDVVLHFVQNQLLQFGIRNAKLFPVSSKLSLEQKVNQAPLNNEMKLFEDEFYHFIQHELADLTVQAAIWDMKRAKITLKNYLQTLNLNQKERNHHIDTLNKKRNDFKKIINNLKMNRMEQRVKERMERQLHFVLERLYIRFHDMFSEHFNPTTITASGRRAILQLEHNRNKFIDYVGYELLQEVRAVSLRIEAFMKKLLKEMYEQVRRDIISTDDAVIIASWKEIHFETPNYEQAFMKLNTIVFSKALKLFKNTKSFFEGNERERMKEAFYKVLHPYAKKYIDDQRDIMTQLYGLQFQQAFHKIHERLVKEIDVTMDEHIKVLTEVEDVTELESKYEIIEQVVSEVGEEKIE